MNKTLSSKIVKENNAHSWLDVVDVKEAVRRLKEEFEQQWREDGLTALSMDNAINEIFGKELSK